MTEENQRFNYDAVAVRVVEQAARVLPYFDQDSEEHIEVASLFGELEHCIKEAQNPSPEPRLERYFVTKALDKLMSLELLIRDSGAPTDLEETFKHEMKPVYARYFALMRQYPSLEDKLTMHEVEESRKESAPKVPEEWTQRMIKKLHEELENPTVKRRH